MIPARQTYRVIESTGRRLVGAFQLVDAATTLPVRGPGSLVVRSATIGTPPTAVTIDGRSVRIIRNRSGIYVILRAPFFETYTSTFDAPVAPAETTTGPLRLQIGALDVGPQYLPQEFEIDIPRSLDPDALDTVFAAQPVAVYRAPAAPIQDGWAVLRVLVTQAGTSPPTRLPGVLVRVFNAPRGASDSPIGAGMTEWRGDTRGEALVPVTALQRFKPGGGAAVLEADHEIAFDVTRDTAFTGDTDQLPNGPRIAAGTAAGIVHPPDGGAQLKVLSPAPPVLVRAGREYSIHLEMS